MNRSLLHWIRAFAAVGLSVSVLFLFLQWLIERYPRLDARWGYIAERAMRIVWPSSVWLMATEGIEATARGVLFVLVSVVGNILTYAVLGAVLWPIARLIAIKRAV